MTNIVFDIGGVLADFNIDEFISSSFDEKTAAAVSSATWHGPYWGELDRGVLSDEEVLELFISEAPLYEREIRFLFAKLWSCLHMKDTSIPLVKQLKAEGFGVYYLSNYFEYLIHTAPWGLEFTEHMDGGIYSCHYHICKPDPEIYLTLCRKYSLLPEDCIFIDDREENVRGAVNVGMKGIHYTGQSPVELMAQIAKTAQQ